MSKILAFVRSNAIALIALFIALGGTGYAAVNLRPGSVGSRQLRNGAVTNKKLRNGSVTPSKLSGNDIAGSVAMWARISPSGTVIASKPQAQLLGWTSVAAAGDISWGRAIPVGCFSLATVDGPSADGFANVATLSGANRSAAFVLVRTFSSSGQPTPEPVNVAVICP